MNSLSSDQKALDVRLLQTDPLAGVAVMTSKTLLNRLNSIADCKHCNVGARQAARDAIALIESLQAQVEELNTVGADYDKALCDITMNLDEPRSAKTAQKALDKHALGTPQ